jgi:hypothetical protein
MSSSKLFIFVFQMESFEEDEDSFPMNFGKILFWNFFFLTKPALH